MGRLRVWDDCASESEKNIIIDGWNECRGEIVRFTEKLLFYGFNLKENTLFFCEKDVFFQYM